MIFLTVGTSFPFDRLVRAVDEAVGQGLIEEQVYGQIGNRLYKPLNFRYVVSLEKQLFDEWMQKASRIISHAGIGTITMALDNRKPLLVMPRLKLYGEVVNDHQVAIAKKFEELGHILAAHGAEKLPEKIEQLKTFVPRERIPQPQMVAERIARFLNELATNNKLRG